MKHAIISIVLLFAASSAFAQQSQPCTRSSSTVQMGGVDADVSRCAAALAAQQMGALQGAVIDLQAQVQLDHADIAKLQAELAAAKAPPPAAPSPAPK